MINDKQGANVTSSSSETAAGGTASGNVPVASPGDAKPGEPQAGSMAAIGSNEEAAKEKYARGYALKLTKPGHVHAGKEVKKGATIMLDMAEYRWALDNKIGVPGDKEDAGFEVDQHGNVLKPENEPTIADLEAKAMGAGKKAEEEAA